MKRFLYLAAIALPIIGLVILLYWGYANNKLPFVSTSTDVTGGLSQSPNPQPYESTVPPLEETPEMSPPPSVSIPQGPTIQIQSSKGVVEIKNFYKTAIFVGKNIVTLNASEYYILDYYRKDSSFGIELGGYDPEEMRRARLSAETELLNQLGIDKPTACKLDISVIVSAAKVDPRFEEGNYGLTFCPNAKPL